MKKKVLAIALSVIMVLLMVPPFVAGAAVTDNSQQVVNKGGSNPTLSVNEDGVSVSKTITATAVENYFDITLSVTNKEKVKETATDIVVVMDISNSMNNAQANTTATRMENAKEAASYFVELYAKADGITAERNIGMVQFNTNVSKVFDIQNITENNYATFQSEIDDIVAPAGDNRFTNIEGGLKLAQMMLDETDSDHNKYIILITDGFPTTYIESVDTSNKTIKGWDVMRTWNNPPSSTPTQAKDGLFYDFVLNKACCGTNYSDTGAIKARTLAEEIKASNINIYSIGIDISNQSLQRFLDSSANGVSTVERTSSSYEIGSPTDNTSYANWLGTAIGGGIDFEDGESAFARGDSQAEIKAGFDKIIAGIQTHVQYIPADLRTVTDPMGENIEFSGFYNQNGIIVDAVTGSAVENGENTATYNNSIAWNLAHSGYTTTVIDGDTYHNYTLKYRVRLKTEADGFVSEKTYNTNGQTTLSYYNLDGISSTLDFPIPAVKGYLATAKFTKTDIEGAGLMGAEFALVHKAENCSVCHGDATITNLTGVSDKDGNVSIADIPSGHEYTLIETEQPTNYKKADINIDVDVAYGVVTFDKDDSTVQIKNEPVDAVSIDITGTKTLSGAGKTNADIKAGQFTFTVTNNYDNVTGVPATVSTEAGGALDFGTWTFSKEGTYTFVISENTPPVGYTKADDVTVTVVVAHNKVKDVFETNVTYSGGESIEFANIYTAPGIVGAELDGKADLWEDDVILITPLEENQFNVTLVPDENNDASGYNSEFVSHTPVNTDGTFDLGSVEFTKSGTYTFVVTEDNGGAAGIIYDDDVYKVTYTVELDESTNNLILVSTEITRDGEPATEIFFHNYYYTPDPVDIKFEGIKTLSGAGKTNEDIKAGQFTFTVTNNYDNVTGVPATVSTEAGGALDFGTWTFSEEGTYTFVISENTPSAGYTKADDVTVTVVVTIDKSTNEYETNVTYSSGNSIGFANIYTAPDAITVELKGTKVLVGDKTEIMDGDFTFTVTASDENPADYVGFETTATVEAGGSVDFGVATFLNVGVYEFTITENALGQTGYTYDPAVYVITVTVTLDETTNELVKDVVITKDGETVDAIEFNNSYKPLPAKAPLTLENVLINGPENPTDFDFTFTPDDPSYPALDKNTDDLVIVGNGKIDLGEITFTEEGVYTYTMDEVKEDEEGYTYDENVLYVTYTVTDEDGQLVVERSIVDKDGNPMDELIFINYYEEPVKDVDIPNTNAEFVTVWAIALTLSLGMTLMLLASRKRRTE